MELNNNYDVIAYDDQHIIRIDSPDLVSFFYLDVSLLNSKQTFEQQLNISKEMVKRINNWDKAIDILKNVRDFESEQFLKEIGETEP